MIPTRRRRQGRRLVLPHLKGKLTASAIRVPPPRVGRRPHRRAQQAGQRAGRSTRHSARRPPAGCAAFLDATDEELVSVDFNGNPHSSIVDLRPRPSSTQHGQGAGVVRQRWVIPRGCANLIKYIGKVL